MLFFSKENGLCIFYQFWEIWATNEKKFVLFLLKNTKNERKLTSFLDQNIAYKTLVQFTKPWTL